jgi:hypothetical protein
MHDLKSAYAYRYSEICKLSQNYTNFHKFQNVYNHPYLCFKHCTLVPDDGIQGSKQLALIDDIIKIFFSIDTNIHVILIFHSTTGRVLLKLTLKHGQTADNRKRMTMKNVSR